MHKSSVLLCCCLILASACCPKYKPVPANHVTATYTISYTVVDVNDKSKAVQVNGIVTDLKGRPIKGARIQFTRYNKVTEKLVVGDSGRFEFSFQYDSDDFNHAMIKIEAEACSTRVMRVFLLPGNTNIEIALFPSWG